MRKVRRRRKGRIKGMLKLEEIGEGRDAMK
jgi:hypothetical protein